MLDNMADSNYDEYKQFVSKHVSEGFEKIKEEKTQKQNEKKITPKPGILLKFNGNLKELQLKEKDEKTDFFKKLIVNNEKKEVKPQKTFEKSMKFYLNLCSSEK